MTELPFFKAFPTDWEVAMIAAGIPAARRGDLYRLIFFAWQQGGLNLTPDATYKARMRVLAQAFGIKPCHFESLLDLYRLLATENNGLWLPDFLLEQFVNVTRFQSKKRPTSARVEVESRRDEDELKTGSTRVEDELKTKIAANSFVPDTPLAELSRDIAEGDARAHASEDTAEPLVDALLEILPGTDLRQQHAIVALAIQSQATVEDLRRFPSWLEENHPRKALTPWAVRDLLPAVARQRRDAVARASPAPRRSCGRCAQGWVIAPGPDGFPVSQPCPNCGGKNGKIDSTASDRLSA